MSKCSNDTGGLDVYEWSKENGGNVNQWNYWEGGCQLWSLSPVHPQVTDGNYTVRSLTSELFMADIYDKIVQTDINNIDFERDPSGAPEPFNVNDQIWSFTKLDDGRYSVRKQNGKALTLNSGKLSVTEYTGADEQKFSVICNKDGSYSLMQGENCIDSGNTSKEGTELGSAAFTGADSQKFILEPAIPKEIQLPIKGDVNNDGEVNVADLLMLQKNLLGNVSVTSSYNADINEDGAVDIFDNVELRKLLINK